ncbi:MAG: tRNA (adenine-N1)-methyltransferase [Chloroflexota bacterium]|nr:tRNA (adenine-N1)-methyltransferase [Chloroflexota bacterium]
MTTDQSSPTSRGPFSEGDMALLVDRKGRHYLITLAAGGTFHTHVGVLPHADLLGKEPGCWVFTSKNNRLHATRPTLADFVVEMPRRTQVIYPKDIGAILLLADIFPGARILEAGMGSGALTIALLHAVGDRGHVTSYDLEQERIRKALDNVRRFVHAPTNLVTKVCDVYQRIEERGLDRIVLDVPEPWHVVPHAIESLAPSGILLSFLPTTLQIHRLVGALEATGRFTMIETVELMLRPWHVTERSVRPSHRMVAHTGFLTTARLCDYYKRPTLTETRPEEEERGADERAGPGASEGHGEER